ncbi:glial fibrillary acidic protein-like isoform X2 [Girardinichthys multiradiatus]|uniref:glial fibrillary acidic protein-like isoform X2 n=1 Tax=Girardinichthys multiradiatus TaxID=208333 RepID=UPI001FACC592|nr:glial fibrillary acidic protein-like isoform X2 [Girardinichthys multiradiatus]
MNGAGQRQRRRSLENINFSAIGWGQASRRNLDVHGCEQHYLHKKTQKSTTGSSDRKLGHQSAEVLQLQLTAEPLQLLPIKMEKTDSSPNFGDQQTTQPPAGMSRDNESYMNEPNKNNPVFEPSTDVPIFKIDFENILSTQSKDSILMKELNDRFANYIENIRSLEKQNQKLIVQIKQAQCDKENQRDLLSVKESSLFLENENLKIDNSTLNQKIMELERRLTNESNGRLEAEERITNLLESTTLEFQSLQQKYSKQTEVISNLEVQINKKTQNEEYSRTKLTNNVSTTCTGDTTDGAKIDLNKIREEIDAIAKRNVTEIEKMYKSKEVEWKKTESDIKTELIKVSREKEEYSRKIEQYKSEIKFLKIENTQIQGLKVQIEEINKIHQDEISTFQESIKTLEGNMTVKEEEIESRFNKYKDLQSAMLKMQTEIAAYKHLLEVEESRINPTVPNEFNPRSEEDDETSEKKKEPPSDDMTDPSATDEDSKPDTASDDDKD